MKPFNNFVFLGAVCLLPLKAFSTPDADLPVPPSGWDETQDVPHGEVTGNISYQTRNEGTQVYRVHFPPGYSDEKKYPVLYLHHGITDDQTTWTNNSKGRAHHIMDNLYAEEKAIPMIIIMVDGSIGSQGYDNAQGYALFEDVLLNDLIPHVEETYSVYTDPVNRAIGGLSMGGGQTLNFGFGNPTVFNWIGAFSSAPNTISANQTIQDPDLINENVRFSYLSCGTEDGLIANTNNYHNFLDQNDIGPHMYQLEKGEAHSWEAFNRSLYHYVQRIFEEEPTSVSWNIQRLPRGKVIRMGNAFQLHPAPLGQPVMFNAFGRSFPLKRTDGLYVAEGLPSGMYLVKWANAETSFQRRVIQK